MYANLDLNLARLGATAVTFSQSGTTDNQGTALIYWFVGDPESVAKTWLSDTYDINFEIDGELDTSINSTGIIPTDAAASNTLGEIADLINASTTGWRARIVSGLYDTVTASGVGGTAYLDLTGIGNSGAKTTLTFGEPIGIPWDVSAVEKLWFCIGPEALYEQPQYAPWLSALSVPPVERSPAVENLGRQQYNGSNFQNILQSFAGLVGRSGGGGTATFYVYSAKQTDTSTSALSIALADNSFTDDTLNEMGGVGQILAVSRPGERLVCYLDFDTSGAALDAISGLASGVVCSKAVMSAQSV